MPNKAIDNLYINKPIYELSYCFNLYVTEDKSDLSVFKSPNNNFFIYNTHYFLAFVKCAGKFGITCKASENGLLWVYKFSNDTMDENTIIVHMGFIQCCENKILEGIEF